MKLFLFSKMAEISLNDYLINQCSSGVGEECARVWFRQICEAVQYLHNVHKVSHRNIKPENILLFPNSKVNNNSNKIPLNAKLSDCGIADLFPNCSKVCTQTDPIFVISPLETSSNELMVYDIYTVGVVLMLMLKGDTKSLVENNKPFALFCQMTDKYVNEISDRQLSDLLEKMVNSSVGSRIDMSAILSHPWVKRSSKAYNELKTKSISNYS